VTLAPEDHPRGPCLPGDHDADRRGTHRNVLNVIPAQVPGDRDQAFRSSPCRACTGTVVAGTGAGPVDRGRHPRPRRLVAHVLVARLLPIICRCYRQAQIMQRQGVILERSTLFVLDGITPQAEVAPVVVAAARDDCWPSTRIFADETVVPVLESRPRADQAGILLGDGALTIAHGAAANRPPVVYSYAPGRGHIHPRQTCLLGGYRGILQCDGYQALQETRRAQADRDFP